MKAYIKENRPTISLILVTILFFSNLLTLMIPSISETFMLFPSNLYEPFNWYRLITYPLFVGGILTWVQNSLFIVLTGFIIEKKLKSRDLVGLILLSTTIGGIIFIIINQGEAYDIPIASPTMISWGYLSSTIVIGLRNWNVLNLFEKIVLIVCFLSLFGIKNDNFGFLVGQISVISIITILTLMKLKK